MMRAFVLASLSAVALAGCNTSTSAPVPQLVSQSDDLATRTLSQLMLDEGIAGGISEACPAFAVRPSLDSRVRSAIFGLLSAGYTIEQVEQIAKQAANSMESSTTDATISAYVMRQQAAAGPGATACDLAANEVRQGTPVGQLLIRR